MFGTNDDTMNLHAICHAPFEGLSNISVWAKERGHSVTESHLDQTVFFPSHSHYDCLIIMGGPMGAYDEDVYPWLIDEKRFIDEAISKDKLIIGACLGSQILADVLGGRVYPQQEQEIGWFPVTLSAEGKNSPIFQGVPSSFTALHWHGDTFDLGKSCLHLAESECCKHQAFSYGKRVFGLQFHLELSETDAQALAEEDDLENKRGKYIQTPRDIFAAQETFIQANVVLYRVLDNFVKLRAV